MLKKIVKGLLLAVVALVVLSMPVLAAVAYRAPYTIIESSSNAYAMLPVIEPVDNQWLADNGFMLATAQDTRIQTLGGSLKPHMVVDDKTLTAVAVPANSQTNLYFTTANAATAFDVITGYNGYITVADDADLELTNSFVIELDDVYVNTDAGAGKYLIYKDGAIEVFIDGATNISVELTSGALSSSYDPTANGTINENDIIGGQPTSWQTVIDDNDATYMQCIHGDALNETDLYVNPAIFTDRSATDVIVSVQVYWRAKEDTDPAVGEAELYINAAEYVGGHEQYLAAWTWFNNNWTQNPDTAVDWLVADLNGIEFGYNQHEEGAGVMANTSECYVTIHYRQTAEVTAINVPSGVHDVEITLSGGTLSISVDSAVAGDFYDNVAFAGNVADNGNDWIIMDNSTVDFMHYFGSYEHTTAVGGVSLKAHYEPNAIVVNTNSGGTETAGGSATLITAAEITEAINYWVGGLVTITAAAGAAPEGESRVCTASTVGTITVAPAFSANVDIGDTFIVEFGTLIDREAPVENGRITWGANPTGVAVSLGSMVSEGQPVPGLEAEEASRDILPETEVSDWYVDPDVGGSLLTNPLRPFVTIMSDTTNLTEILAWRLLAAAAILFVTVATSMAVGSHQGITAIMAGATILGAVVLTIFPMWALVVAIGLFIGGLVMERSSSF